jgi:flagellar biosynthesis/type III secretory pathway protein FliH
MAPLGPDVLMPEELLEMRNMLATRIELWKQDCLLKGEQKGRQEGRQEGRLEGRQEGRKQGEAALLLRQLERRFGILPGWATDRVLAADTVMIEEWALRVLDAASLEAVFA